jgi:small basic protein
LIARVGLLVGIAMGLMKVVPAVPGHFTMYEWIALAAWIAVGGVAAASRTRRTVIKVL